ncbi:RNA polymerase sigma factor [Ruminococcus sp. NK3A76]|uniref:RNA polymerase sigma factor n=1 Tax=Ruminococcus sp. NK3A76 TaxID=877411 RepID=UPI000490D3D1|nr:RNA polymerase sigma factor [Ruminococcus sp. NK3A76]
MLVFYLSAIETNEDKNRFKEIYKELRQSLYLDALSIVKNPEDAEDIVEDTFLKVADNFTEISQKNRQKMRAYIVIINRNNAIDRYNQNKKSLEKNDDTPLEEIIDPSYFDSFEYDDLYNAIKKLPPKYKDIIYLYDLLDIGTKATAHALHISIDTVYKRVSRARALLKRLLEKGEINE